MSPARRKSPSKKAAADKPRAKPAKSAPAKKTSRKVKASKAAKAAPKAKVVVRRAPAKPVRAKPGKKSLAPRNLVRAPLPKGLKPVKAAAKPPKSASKKYAAAKAASTKSSSKAQPTKAFPVPRPDAPVADKPKSNLFVIDGVPTLVVANTDVKDSKIHLKVKAPTQLTLPTLHILKLQHTFRLLDATKDQQECRFVLKAKIGGQEPAPDLVRTGDAWGASRDRIGHTQQIFRVPPGRSRLEVEVHAEVYTTERKTGKVVSHHDKRATATIELHGT